jgi:hypothetical protein
MTREYSPGLALDLGLLKSFGCRDSGFGFRVLGFGIRDSGFGVRVESLDRIWISAHMPELAMIHNLRISDGFGFSVSGAGLGAPEPSREARR